MLSRKVLGFRLKLIGLVDFFSLILNPKKVHLSLPAQNTVGMSLLEKYFNIESKSEIVWRTRSSIDLEDQTSQLEVIEQTGLQ